MGNLTTQRPAHVQTSASKENDPSKRSTDTAYHSDIRQFAGMSPQKILQMQKTIGNRAVMQLLKSMQGTQSAQAASSLEEESTPVPNEENEPLQEEQEEFHEDLTDIRLPITLGDEQHHLCVEIIDGKPEIGMHSDWTNMSDFVKDLVLRLNKIGVLGKYQDLYRVIIDTHSRGLYLITEAEEKLANPRNRTKAQEIREEYEQKINVVIEELKTLIDQFDEADVEEAYKFGKIVSIHKADSTADTSKYTYHTGEASDPIPIVWYKAPTDYKNVPVKVNGGSLTLTPYGNNPPINVDGDDYKFGVTSTNQVKVGTVLRKSESDGNRANQQHLNKVLHALGYPMNNEDGDHVKDLGFGGADEIENFWPLDSTINRSAFFKYNPSYVVNYIKNNQHVAAGIGSMVGKYFEVTGFESGVVPQESNTAKAGGTPK